MKFKNEYGISDIIAIIALVVSFVACWQSYKANEGFIVKAGGPWVISNLGDECSVMVSIPVEFYNTGKTAVTLERFTPDKLEKVILSKNNNLLLNHKVGYDFYIVDGDFSEPKKLYQQAKKVGVYDLNSYAISDYLIKPNSVFKTNIVIVSKAFVDEQQVFDRVYVSLNASFSNDQVIEIKGTIGVDVPRKYFQNCKS